jgi:hypothetical protein
MNEGIFEIFFGENHMKNVRSAHVLMGGRYDFAVEKSTKSYYNVRRKRMKNKIQKKLTRRHFACAVGTISHAGTLSLDVARSGR